MKNLNIVSTLQKSAAVPYEVGGVASSFHRDLDGEAITPDAVRRAIPDFMASRGADGIQGGPIRLHHDFWQRFLKQAIETLRLPLDQQMEMVAAISLPLGRVTKMWVDEQGTTHWRGVLSMANPIAKIVWGMLKEGLIHLGVSLGGKILNTQAHGRDRMGRACTLITDIRIDELSVTDNPALRLTQEEDTGAYISALAKSVRSAIQTPRDTQQMKDERVVRFLKKSIATDIGNGAGFGRVADSGTTTGMGSRGLGEPKSTRPRGGGSIKLDSSTTTTGMGGTSKASPRPRASGNEPKTDVWGMTVEGFARELSKCASCMNKAQISDEPMLKMLTDGAYGLTQITDVPPEPLINLVRFLQHYTQFAQTLPYMDSYQADGTIEAMGRDLSKALEEFQEKMPADLMQQRFRPPTAGSVSSLDIVFPQQYVTY